MRKVVFFILLLLTFYLAGMYRQFPLLVLAGAGALAGIAALIQSRILKRQVRLEFVKHAGTVPVGEKISCAVRAAQEGHMRPGRTAFRVKYGYPLAGREREKWVYGAAFELSAPCCGQILLRADRVKIYDSFFLFGAKKRCEEEMRITVLPREAALRIEMSPEFMEEAWRDTGDSEGRDSDASQEIRQLREYRPGDHNRHIHWNLSAKMEELWVREYERESDKAVTIWLEKGKNLPVSVKEMDRFYVLLSALISGLLRYTKVQVGWYEPQTDTRVAELVSDEGEKRRMMDDLYFLEECFLKEGGNLPPAEAGFRLNLKLEWFWRERLICRFSERNLEREIRERIFVV